MSCVQGETYNYNVYNRLIMDFGELVSQDDKEYLIQKGKKLFIPEVTTYWV